jgi:hypothetical protein
MKNRNGLSCPSCSSMFEFSCSLSGSRLPEGSRWIHFSHGQICRYIAIMSHCLSHIVTFGGLDVACAVAFGYICRWYRKYPLSPLSKASDSSIGS